MTRPDLKIVSNIKEPAAADPYRKDDARYSNAATGHRIRAVRVTRGITESACAAACKVSLRTYRRWEAGGGIRRWLDQMKCLAKLFDCHPCWLSLGSGDSPTNPTEGRIAFMSAQRHRKSNPATASHTLTGQELGEKYEFLTVEHKAYVSGVIAAFLSLRGDPPPAA